MRVGGTKPSTSGMPAVGSGAGVPMHWWGSGLGGFLRQTSPEDKLSLLCHPAQSSSPCPGGKAPRGHPPTAGPLHRLHEHLCAWHTQTAEHILLRGDGAPEELPWGLCQRFPANGPWEPGNSRGRATGARGPSGSALTHAGCHEEVNICRQLLQGALRSSLSYLPALWGRRASGGTLGASMAADGKFWHFHGHLRAVWGGLWVCSTAQVQLPAKERLRREMHLGSLLLPLGLTLLAAPLSSQAQSPLPSPESAPAA